MNEDTRRHLLKLADEIDHGHTIFPGLWGSHATQAAVAAGLRELAEEPRRTLLELAGEFEVVAVGLGRKALDELATGSKQGVALFLASDGEGTAFYRAAVRLRERAECAQDAGDRQEGDAIAAHSPAVESPAPNICCVCLTEILDGDEYEEGTEGRKAHALCDRIPGEEDMQGAEWSGALPGQALAGSSPAPLRSDPTLCRVCGEEIDPCCEECLYDETQDRLEAHLAATRWELEKAKEEFYTPVDICPNCHGTAPEGSTGNCGNEWHRGRK